MLSPGRHICNLKISKSLTIRAIQSEDHRAHTSTESRSGGGGGGGGDGGGGGGGGRAGGRESECGVVLVGVGNKAIVTINAPCSSSSASSSCGGGASRDAGAVASRYLLA
jgi:hypothetical protein